MKSGMKMIQTRRLKLMDSIQFPILITGAHGMLGWELTRHFQSVLGSEKVVATDLPDLDITDSKQVHDRLENLKPKIIINAAAYTNVDGAEKDREQAHLLNAVAPRILSRACHKYGIKLVHFSTDHVFDGTDETPRKETDEPSPVNYYAETKLLGEREVLSLENALVLRIQWLYGERKDRFTSLRDKEKFTPIVDQFGAPTWTRDVVEVLFELLIRKASGLYHFAYDDYASWVDVFEFARQELELTLTLIPKKTSEFSLPAKRPLYSVMSNVKLLETLERDSLGSWKDSFREFLNIVNKK